MRKALLFHVMAALLCLSIVSAASAQTAKPEQTMTTLVGCLVQGLPSAASGERRSEAGAAHANDYFVRTPTVVLPVGATVAVGKPGTTSTATSAGTAASDSFYRITGLDRDQLQPHAGHRVELRGRLNPEPATSTTARTTVDAAGRATTRTETRVEVAGVLHATAIKMVSASCQ
jgi:hypothetical protein